MVQEMFDIEPANLPNPPQLICTGMWLSSKGGVSGTCVSGAKSAMLVSKIVSSTSLPACMPHALPIT
jgi:hypothetical protein